MKWLWIILLIVVGIVAAVFAYEYLTLSIGHLPSWVPGHLATKAPGNGKCTGAYRLKDGICYATGHARKRGYLALVIAIAAFVGAGWMIYKERMTGSSGSQTTAAA